TGAARFRRGQLPRRAGTIAKTSTASRRARGATLSQRRRKRRSARMAHVGLWLDAGALLAATATGLTGLRASNHARFHSGRGAVVAAHGGELPRVVRGTLRAVTGCS